MVLESTHAGAFEPQMRIDPLRLYRYSGPAGFMLLLTEVCSQLELEFASQHL